MIEQFKQLTATLQTLLVTYGSTMQRKHREGGEEALAKALDTIAERERLKGFDEFSPGVVDDEVNEVDDYHCDTCGQLFPECDCEELLDEDDEEELLA